MILQEKPRAGNGAAAQLSIFPESIQKMNRALVPHVQKMLAVADPFGEYRMIATSELHTESIYQRSVSADRVLEMCRTFDAALFQPLTIAQRKTVLYVVDGQHRLTTARELKIPEVPCMVYQSKDAAQEARRFVELQEKRRTLLSFHKFQAQLAYGDPVATELSKLFAKYKFEVQSGNAWSQRRTDNRLRCISIMQTIFRHGGRDRCEFVLYVLRNAFDGSSDAQRREMIQGLARFAESTDISAKDVVKAFLAKDTDPFDFLQRVKRRAHSNGIKEPQAFTDVLTSLVVR